jgi:tetratricopeptide (TPR) repeat protein
MSKVKLFSTALAVAILVPTATAQQGNGLPPGVTREQMWYAPSAEDWAKPCLVPWQRTWADAVDLSRQTRKAILVCVNMDGEIASEHWAGIRYRDPEIAALFDQYVCVIASTFRHNPVDYDAEGNRIPCPRFGTVTCGEHIWMEPTVFGKFLDDTRVAPRHIMVELDGSETYDIYYANDIDTIVQTVEKGIAEREVRPEEPPQGDRTLAELVASPNAVDRAHVEQAWSGGDRQTRKEILAAAESLGAKAPVDLLRKAAYGFDGELSTQALELLAESGDDKAVGLMNDLLHGPLAPRHRAALLAGLERLSDQVPMAKRLAMVHRGLGGSSTLLDVSAWNEAMADYTATSEADEEAVGGASALLAEAVRPENVAALHGRSLRARKVATEQFRLALEAARKELAAAPDSWSPHAIVAIASSYLGDTQGTTAAARQALGLLPPGETSWNAFAVLSIFAEGRRTAIRDAADAKRSWPPEWLSEVQSAYAVLAAHPLTTTTEVVRHYDFLVRLGAVAPAGRVLQQGLEAFPDSGALHERFRLLMVAERGVDGVEASYSSWLQRSDAPRYLRWFAGQASLFTAEQLRKLNRLADADAAYARALEYFSEQVAAAPETAGNSATFEVLAMAGRARIALESGDTSTALALILAAFEHRPEAAATLDGQQVSPVGTARKILAALQQAGDEAGVGRLQAALDALGDLDTGLLELPQFERRIDRR